MYWINKIYLIMLIYTAKSKCDWSLIWNDEFEGNQLDYSKWSVTDGQDVLESPVNEEILSFSRDSKETIQLVDGYLAITAVQESYQGRGFSTATINSKESLLYGRVDIRAALPMGNLLKTAILLLPEKNEYGRDRVNGEIEIVADVQRENYYSRVSFNNEFGAQPTYPSLNGFHDYSLQWNETSIVFQLNGSNRRTFDLDKILDGYYQKKGQPFDKKFHITIRLQVFRFITDDLVITENYHDNWKCPSILIDYIRIYQQDNFTHTSENISNHLKNSNQTKDDLCKSVNKKLSKFYRQINIDFSLVWKIGVPICSLVISIGLVILILIVVRRKRQDIITERSEPDNYLNLYEDVGRLGNYAGYDEINLRTPNSLIDEQAQSVKYIQETDLLQMKI